MKEKSAYQFKHTKTVSLFIGGLPQETNELELIYLLSQHFTVLKLELNKRKKGSKCLGHGTLIIPLSEERMALQTDHITYKQRKVKIMRNMKGEELRKFQKEFGMRRLYLKNLSPDIKADELNDIFSRFGDIESCYIRGEPLSETKIGIVIFTEKESARVAYCKFRYGSLRFLEERCERLKIGFCYTELVKESREEFSNKKGRRKFFRKDKEFKNRMINGYFKRMSIKPGKIDFDYESIKGIERGEENYFFRKTDMKGFFNKRTKRLQVQFYR